MNKFKLSLFFILVAPLLSSTAQAFEEYEFSASEVRQLPPFCAGFPINFYRDDAKSLKRNIKVPGQHTHHFCHGMKEILRKNYAGAVKEFEYVQSQSTIQHELLDSTSLYKAEALGMLGKTGPAIQEYNKAIQLNPKYHQAYERLADFYLKLGMKQDALDVINTGLKYSPNSKGLKRRLQKFTTQK